MKTSWNWIFLSKIVRKRGKCGVKIRESLPVVDTRPWKECYGFQIQRLYKFSKGGLIWRCVCKIKYLVWWAISIKISFSWPQMVFFYLFNMLLEHFPDTRYLRSVWVLNSLKYNFEILIMVPRISQLRIMCLKVQIYLESIMKSE